jgi:cell division protein ZapA
MKQLEVQIMGHSYLLGCPPDGDARLLDAVNRVDLAMCKIRDSGKIKARDRIAVLAALNLAFEVPEQGPTTQAPATPDREQAQLSLLLQRLDAALGQDGRLL